MVGKRSCTRRAALASIGAGTALTLGSTHGYSLIEADRGTMLDSTEDPSAVLGLDGHGAVSDDDPADDDIEVTNNSNTHDMSVTVTTTNFTIENDGDGGSDRQWTFSLAPGDSQLVTFFQQDGNQDDVEFDATLQDSGGATVGSVELARTLSIPAAGGTTYRIRNANSGQYMTLENGNPNQPRNVRQEPLATNDASQEWQIVDNPDGTVRLENQSNAGGGGAAPVLSIDQNPPFWDNTVSIIARGWSGADDQRWYLEVDAEGRYTIRTADGDYADPHVADVEGDSTARGADVIIWEREPVDDPDPENQRWIFEAV